MEILPSYILLEIIIYPDAIIYLVSIFHNTIETFHNMMNKKKTEYI